MPGAPKKARQMPGYSGSLNLETIQGHNLGPGGDEVLHKLLLAINWSPLHRQHPVFRPDLVACWIGGQGTLP